MSQRSSRVGMQIMFPIPVTNFGSYAWAVTLSFKRVKQCQLEGWKISTLSHLSWPIYIDINLVDDCPPHPWNIFSNIFLFIVAPFFVLSSKRRIRWRNVASGRLQAAPRPVPSRDKPLNQLISIDR